MWPNSDETQELLRNAEGGDAEAIEALLDRHRTSIQQLVRMRMDRAVAQRVDASDVVQDVLLEASLRLDDFIQAGKMPFHLWLRQLAKDRIIDMHRHIAEHNVAALIASNRWSPPFPAINLLSILLHN